ncbi:hypothetical protein Drorol1_Dr00021760 [Drosera rotundifolia]
MLTKRDDTEANPSRSSGSGSRDRCSDQVSVSVKREWGGEEAVEVERVWLPTSEEREDDQDGGNRKKVRSKSKRWLNNSIFLRLKVPSSFGLPSSSFFLCFVVNI